MSKTVSLREAKNFFEDRRFRADAVFEHIELGVTVEDHEGWETFHGFGKEHAPNEWSKRVYLKNEENPDGPTISAIFTVTFNKNSIVPIQARLNDTILKLPKF